MSALIPFTLFTLNALPVGWLLLGVLSTGTVFVFIPGVIAVWVIFRRARPDRWLRGWAATAYAWAAVATWLIGAGKFEHAFDAPLYNMHLLAVALALVAWKSRPTSRVFRFGVWALALWLGFVLLRTKQVPVILLYGAILATVIRERERFLFALSLHAWKSAVPAVAALGTLGFVGILRLAPRSELHDAITAQPGVESVIDFGSGQWPYGLGREIRFLADSCDGQSLIIGLTDERFKTTSLLRYSLAGHSFEFNRDVVRSSNTIVQDCGRGMFYVGSEVNERILAFPEDGPLDPVVSIPLPGSAPRFLQPLQGGRFLAAIDDNGFRVRVVDLLEYREVSLPDELKTQCAFAYGDNRLWIAHHYEPLTVEVVDILPSLPHRLGRVDLQGVVESSVVIREGETLGRRLYAYGQGPRIPSGPRGWCAFDPVAARIWYPDFASGEIRGVDLRTGRTTVNLALGVGVRFLAFDDSFSRFASVNYLTGELTLLDSASFPPRSKDDERNAHEIHASGRSILRSATVGPRVRFVDFSKDGRFVYSASSAGVFRVHAPFAEAR